MFLRFIFACLLFCSSLTFAVDEQPANFVSCSPELRSFMEKIDKVPEARELIFAVLREGAIRITVNQHPLSQQFGAFWDVDERTICVNPGSHGAGGEVLGSIIFELHNALRDSKLRHYDEMATQGRISKEKYVEAIEYIEFCNSHDAARIAEKGIAMGIFPREARLPTYPTFEEHFRVQKLGGHSAWIAKTYDQLTSVYYQ